MTYRSAYDPFEPLRRRSRRTIADVLFIYGPKDNKLVVEFKRRSKEPPNAFVEGMGRLIDIAGAYDNPFASDEAPDSRSIAFDWWQVGQDLERAFQTASSKHTGALVTITSTLLFRRQKEIAELANKYRLPSMFEGSSWVDGGGLISYSTNDGEVFRRAAIYVDKILKGAKPADLPIEQPTRFELFVNLNTAKKLGIAVPQSVLLRADRVIE